MAQIDRALLAQHHDFDSSRDRVLTALREAMHSPSGIVRFLGRYTSWNGFFGSAVAALAGKIGRSRSVFLDPSEPVELLADRSVFVGSFFFDAARDEFDDRDTPHRDTHRCLAQAVVGGVLAYCRKEVPDGPFLDHQAINDMLLEPPWLRALNQQVAHGYGNGTSDDLLGISRAMGYHLGSEILADQEFTQIDQALRTTYPELVEFLSATEVEIAGQAHNAYQWIAIHSGHGGGAEADHFEWAVQGVHRGQRYARATLADDMVSQILLGFSDFARDHRTFFDNVNRE